MSGRAESPSTTPTLSPSPPPPPPPPSPPFLDLPDEGNDTSSISQAVLFIILFSCLALGIVVGGSLYWRHRKRLRRWQSTAHQPTTTSPKPNKNANKNKTQKGAKPTNNRPATRPDFSLVVTELPTMPAAEDPVLKWATSMAPEQPVYMDKTSNSVETGIYDVPDHIRDLEFAWSEVRVVQPLGIGSFGKVYLCELNHAPVAIKLLLDPQAATTAAIALDNDAGSFPAPGGSVAIAPLKKLVEEISVMAKLHHPSVAHLTGFCLNPPSLAMEYYARGSLFDVLQRGNSQPEAAMELTWPCRLGMAADAAAGMLHLHTRSPRILHRDLKSANLRVAADWTVKVSDMGLSKLLGDKEPVSATAGGAVGGRMRLNPRFLAPEVLEGGDYTTASDVFSFGVIMWEMLMWKVPWAQYGGDTSHRIIQGVVQGQRPPIPKKKKLPGFKGEQLPPSLDAFIALMKRCWAQDPEERPSFGHVAAELRNMR